MLETALSKLQLSLAKVDLSAAIERFNFTTKDDLLAAIGSGNTRLLQVVHCLQQQEKKLKPEVEIDPQSLIRQPQQGGAQTGDNNGITVSGVGNLLTHMAKCCHPVPGDEISGFITQGRGISVHRVDCEQLAHALNQQPEREVEVQWGIDSKKSYQVSINIIGGDRQGLLRDISTIISNERVSIIGLESNTDNAKQSMSMTIKVEIANNEALTRLLAKLKQLDDVTEVKRL
jgi:GTP pyrophosphokinase